jgi:hypothetical protein
MKLFKTGALTLICSAAIFAACKKDKDNSSTPATPKTAKDYLAEGKWQIESQLTTEIINGVSHTYNEYDSMAACDKDDILTFGTNGRVYSDDNTNKCGGSKPQIDSTGTWSLPGDTKLLITDGGSTDTLDVLISATSFQFTARDSDVNYYYTTVRKYKNVK